MEKEKNYLELRDFSLGLGPDLFGVADISSIKHEFILSSRIRQEITAGISLAARLSAGVLEDIEDAPTRLYFHHYRTVNAFLDQCAFKVGAYIQGKGFLAIPIAASQIVDWQKQNAHLSHKKVGYLAGLGWIGRNNLLVNERLGSQFRLVTVLTNMPLKMDSPSSQSCGSCRRCVEFCPAQAIKDSPEDFDHQRCFERLKEFQRMRLVDQYICGICVRVCTGKRP